MKLDLNQTIADRDGNQAVSLKAALNFLLDNSAPGNRELMRQCDRLSDRIADSNGSVELKGADIQLLRTALDADKGMKTWAVVAMEYHLWPDELADSDRERLSKRFNGKGGGRK